MQSQKNRIGAQFGAEAALAQFDLRLARLFFEAWIPYFRLFPAAAFEDAQDVAGLRNFPALQRIEKRQHSFPADLFRSGRREGKQSLRFAVGAVALTEAWGLQRERTVVVERRAPQHGAVGHHAGLDFSYFSGVTAAGAAGFVRDAQVSRVDEANVIPVFVEPLGVGSRRVGGAAGIVWIPRLRMGFALGLCILRRVFRSVGGHADFGIAAVAVGASQAHGAGAVHGGAVGGGVAGDAAGGLAVGVGLGLQQEDVGGLGRLRVGRV